LTGIRMFWLDIQKCGLVALWKRQDPALIQIFSTCNTTPVF